MSILLKNYPAKKYFIFLIYAFIILGSVIIGLQITHTDVSASLDVDGVIQSGKCYQTSSTCRWSAERVNSERTCVRRCAATNKCYLSGSTPPCSCQGVGAFAVPIIRSPSCTNWLHCAKDLRTPCNIDSDCGSYSYNDPDGYESGYNKTCPTGNRCTGTANTPDTTPLICSCANGFQDNRGNCECPSATREVVDNSCLLKCGEYETRNPSTNICEKPTCTTNIIEGSCKTVHQVDCGDDIEDEETTCSINSSSSCTGGSCAGYPITVPCSGTGRRCSDSNATCNTSSKSCECNSGYEKFNGTCVEECDSNETRNSSGSCECNTGYTEISGVCTLDGTDDDEGTGDGGATIPEPSLCAQQWVTTTACRRPSTVPRGQPIPNGEETCTNTPDGCTGGDSCPIPNTRAKLCIGRGTLDPLCERKNTCSWRLDCVNDVVWDPCASGANAGTASVKCSGSDEDEDCKNTPKSFTDSQRKICFRFKHQIPDSESCTNSEERDTGEGEQDDVVSCTPACTGDLTCLSGTCGCAGGERQCGTGSNAKCCSTGCAGNVCAPESTYIYYDRYLKTSGVTATPVAGNATKLKVLWNRPRESIQGGDPNFRYVTGSVYYCAGTASQCTQPSNQGNVSLNSRWRQWSGAITTTSSKASTEITGLSSGTEYYVTIFSGVNYSLDSCHVIPSTSCRLTSFFGEYSDKISATTNKQCQFASCGLGTRTTGGVVPAGTTCSTCPTPPTIQSAQTSVNPTSCNTNITFKYTGGNSYRSRMSNGTTLPNKTYSRSTATGLSFYTLKNNDYNKTLTFYTSTRKNTDSSGLWSREAQRQITTPTQPHPKSNFTIQQIDNNQIQLQYTPENRITSAGLRFRWTFSETPRFHNRTNQNSQNPRISFSTPGPKTITLRVTDTNISTTNGHCSSTQTLNAGNEVTTQTQMQAPTINNVTYKLSDGPICAPQARITYTSPESTRTDILNLFIGDTQVHTDRVNVSTPDTRSFIVPINANTIYKAVLTTHDFQKTPTKDPSNPAEYIFTTPNTTTYPTANFTHTVNSDGTLSLNYTGTNTIQWNFKEPVSYIQGSSTSNFAQVQFSTFGQKQVSLTAKSSAPELNSCQYAQTIDVRATQTPQFPIIREIPPVR